MLRLLPLLISCVAAWPSQAATLDVRGKLTDEQGQPQNGSCLLRFALLLLRAQPIEAWSDSIYVPVEDGLFHLTLGKDRPIPSEALMESHQLTVEPPKGTGWKALASLIPPRAGPPARKPAVKKEDETATLKARVAALERRLKPQQEPERRARVYEVKAGDTLQTVAAKLWGDASRWAELYSANADRIQRGGELIPGQKLVVPEVEARP